jgi:predicted CXXCH cytochrome family protein
MWVIFILIALLAPLTVRAEEGCARCHGMKTLAVRLPGEGVRSFYIHPEKFQTSYHRELKCTECHSNEYNAYPHADLPALSSDCLHCHQETWRDQETTEGIQKLKSQKDISLEFKRSIHFDTKMKCETCHNPHEFNLEHERQKGLRNLIQIQNNLCLQCHKNPRQLDLYRKEPKDNYSYRPLELVHSWLPSRELHWQKLRCIDCHSSYGDSNLSHHIVKKEEAVRDCSKCHSNDSILKDKLYKLYSREEKDRKGFLNAVIWNESYIIGATRNLYLDIISTSSFILGLFAMFFHAGFRYRAYLNRRKQDE